LDGGQGNLTISWDGGGLLPSLLRGFKWARAYHEARALARRGAGRSTLRVLVSQGILPLLPTPLWRAVAALRGNRQARAVQPWRTWSPIHPDFAAAQRVDERARARGYDFLFHDTRDSRVALVDALASQDGGAYLSAFRSMFGVDVRSPLGDARLAEFCLALPEEQYLRDGEPRALVRRAMAGRLPPQVLANRQRGLQAADWYERSANARREFAAALDALEGNDLARRALDLARMRRLVEQWPQDGWGEGRVLAEYRFLLESGLMVGRFLQWFETEQGKNFDAAG
jgi:asparagine synthase (glutamine-hydrolysing)